MSCTSRPTTELCAWWLTTADHEHSVDDGQRGAYRGPPAAPALPRFVGRTRVMCHRRLWILGELKISGSFSPRFPRRAQEQTCRRGPKYDVEPELGWMVMGRPSPGVNADTTEAPVCRAVMKRTNDQQRAQYGTRDAQGDGAPSLDCRRVWILCPQGELNLRLTTELCAGRLAAADRGQFIHDD